MTTRPAPAPTRFDRQLVAPMVLGTVLNPVNSSIIAVSLVPIGQAFDASPARTAWLVSGLYLATAIGQPVVGRLVDLLGPRRIYLVGAALVGIAGVLGAVAQDLGTLVVARVVLGLGTCAGYPAAMHLVRSEGRRTGSDNPGGILTVLAVSSQTIAVAGPTLGGLLIGVSGWRATFVVNVPLALACLWLGARRLPRRLARHTELASDDLPGRPRLDLVGILLFGVALVGGLVFAMEREPAWWPLLAVATVAALLFGWVELRSADPFVDLRLLAANRPLLATYARHLLSAVVTYAFVFGYTQWLQETRGLSPAAAGALSVPMFATAIAVSALTGSSPRVRGKLVVGGLAQLAACAALLAVDATTPAVALAGLALLMGVPQGLVGLANQTAVYHQAEPACIGSSAGLLRTSMYVGAVLAGAASGTAYRSGATTRGLHLLALVMLGAAALTLAMVLLDRSLTRLSAGPGAGGSRWRPGSRRRSSTRAARGAR